MKYRVLFAPEVFSQLSSACDYYQNLRDGLGDELEAEVETLLDSIASNPLLYPVDFGVVRRALVRRFSKQLFYKIQGDVITILEFRDARQEPPDWLAHEK